MGVTLLLLYRQLNIVFPRWELSDTEKRKTECGGKIIAWIKTQVHCTRAVWVIMARNYLRWLEDWFGETHEALLWIICQQ